jgi:predicted alpha/beta hydrolase
MTLQGTRSLVALYENAPSEIRSVRPDEFGSTRIGHFGAFRSEQQETLWPRMAGWLRGLAIPRAA